MDEYRLNGLIYKLEYFGLIFSLLIISVGAYRVQPISMGVPLLVSLYFICKNVYEIKSLKILTPLLLLFVLGIRVGTGYPLTHVLRDYAYFLSPLSAFTMGYFLQKYLSLNRYLLLLILFGSLYSLVYFVQVIIEFDTLFVADTESVRYSIGTGTPLPVLSLVFLLLGYNYIKQYKINHVYLLLLIINSLAVYYFASRVYYFTLLLFFVPMLYELLMVKYKRFGKYIFTFIVILIIAVALLLLKGDNFVAEKLRNSLVEMFAQSFEDYDSVISQWRAYELFEAVNTFMNGSFINKIIGFGFGKTVYLEYDLIMPSITINEIPIFHNGYAYLLVKTGLLGIGLQLLFSALLIFQGYKYMKVIPENKFIFSILISSVLSFDFALLVVNGFFSGESCQLIILTGYMFSFLRTSAINYDHKYNYSNI